MRLRQRIRALGTDGWVLAGLVVAAVVVATVLTLLGRPVYTASARVLVSSSSDSGVADLTKAAQVVEQATDSISGVAISASAPSLSLGG